jgi:phage FluMu protein Com
VTKALHDSDNIAMERRCPRCKKIVEVKVTVNNSY